MTDFRFSASRLSLIAGAVCLCALVAQIAGGADTVKSSDVKPGVIQALLSNFVYAPSFVLQSTFLTLAGLFTGFIPQSTKTNLFVHFESSKAKAGVLANIGPNGPRSSGAMVRTALVQRRRLLEPCLGGHSYRKSFQSRPRLRLHLDARRSSSIQGPYRPVSVSPNVPQVI